MYARPPAAAQRPCSFHPSHMRSSATQPQPLGVQGTAPLPPLRYSRSKHSTVLMTAAMPCRCQARVRWGWMLMLVLVLGLATPVGLGIGPRPLAAQAESIPVGLTAGALIEQVKGLIAELRNVGASLGGTA